MDLAKIELFRVMTILDIRLAKIIKRTPYLLGIFLLACAPGSSKKVYEVCDITSGLTTITEGQRISVHGKVSANLSLFERGTYAIEGNGCKIRVYYSNNEAPVSGTFVEVYGSLKEPFTVGTYRRLHLNEEKRIIISPN